MNGGQWDWARIITVVVGGGAWAGAAVAFISARQTRKALADARRKDRSAAALHRFIAICSIPGKATHYDEARRGAAELYSTLGANTEASFIATAAYTCFLGRDSGNPDRRQKIESLRDDIAGHLRDPEAPWQMPETSIVHEDAATFKTNLGNPPWVFSR